MKYESRRYYQRATVFRNYAKIKRITGHKFETMK